VKPAFTKWGIPLLLAVGFAWLTSRGMGGPKFMRLPVGSGAAPAWTMPDLEGRPVASTNFAGQVVLLNFWATWCPPCLAEIPDLKAFQAAHAQEGFTVIGAAVNDEGAAVVKPFVQRNQLNYPVLLAGPDVQMLFGSMPLDPTRPTGFPLPTTFVIGRDGRLVAHYLGALSRAELDKVILPLLARRP
jgi:thiol-disulfide isomerase/thioredoxin